MQTIRKPLNVLVIGTGMYVCGRGTDGHGTILPALYEWTRGREGADIYVAGTGPDSAGIIQKKSHELEKMLGFGISLKYYPQGAVRNPDAYLDALREIPKPACAIVAVPDHLHRRIAEDALRSGLHTLVVKPLSPTSKEVRELISIQEKTGVYCAVEFHKRLDRSNLKLKDTIEKGVIGDPLYFIVEYSQRKNIPTQIFRKWVESTNIFQYLGIHYVDIIYWATGATPRRVSAIGQKNFLLSKGIDTYDAIQAEIEWEMTSGKTFISSFFTNWIDPLHTSAMSDQRIKVIGTKGRFEADQKRRGICTVSDEQEIEEPNPDFCSKYGIRDGEISYRGYGIDSIVRFLDDAALIEEGDLPVSALEGKRPTFKDALIPTMIIEAVNRSLKENGEWVEIGKC